MKFNLEFPIILMFIDDILHTGVVGTVDLS